MVTVNERVSVGESLAIDDFNTSKDAYKKFCERDQEGSQAMRVFAAIMLRKDVGVTIYDIQSITGLKVASILGRLDDLMNPEKVANPRIFADPVKRLNEESNCYNTVYRPIRYNNDWWNQICQTMGWRY